MKKNYAFSLVALFILGAFSLSAQSRMVFVESFTQASCPPCQPANATFDPVAEANEDKTVVIKYQTSWPGFDQMNLDNPGEVQTRVDYYGVSGVPNAFLLGVDAGSPAGITQTVIDNTFAETAEFEMEISGAIENGELVVTGNVTATAAYEGDMVLRVALLEKHITSAQAPGGTNGETDYYHVMKKFLGAGTAGIDVADTWAVGDAYAINETLDLAGLTIYSYGQLEVVAWLQNETTKYTPQAAKDDELEITVDYTNNGTAVEVTNIPAALCTGEVTVSPSVVLQNGGNDALTSATLVYTINGGAEQSFDWTGSLNTFGTETVELPAYTFTAGAVNTIEVTVTNPNGATDEDASDDVTTGIINGAPLTETEEVTLSIMTDNYGFELYWEFRAEDGTVIAFGGNEAVGPNGGGAPYINNAAGPGAYGNGESVEEVVTVPADGCYEFFFVDDFGDGICCDWGNGSYEVADADGNVLFSGGNFTAYHTDPMTAELEENSVTPLDILNAATVYPNPATASATLEFNLSTQADLDITVMNALGQAVSTTSATYRAGNNMETIDVANFANGVYFIVVSGTEGTFSTKFNVVK